MSADPKNLHTLARGTNDLGVNLLKTIGVKGNTALSPISILCAMAMLYLGSAGRTASQLCELFGYPPSHDEAEALIREFLDYVKEISHETAEPDGKEQEDTEEPVFLEESYGDQILTFANAVWGQKDYPFRSSYINRMKQSFDAHIESLQFLPTPENAIETVNQWASKHTRGRINEILDPNLPWGFVRLILTNAVYFKASWTQPFEESITRPGPFHLTDGSTAEAELMKQTETFGYYYSEKKDFKALEMKYGDGKLSLMVLLPGKADGLPELEAWLTGERLSLISEKLQWKEVKVTLPKFKVEGEHQLGETLQTMGAGDAFDQGRADIPGITEMEPVWVTEVIHKVWIDLNEKGTEAAAVTAVMIAVGAMEGDPPEPETFCADHPFLFFIRDRASGLVLFCGRMTQP